MLLTRDQIIGRRPPHQDVKVPEWGADVTVRIQQWTVGQRNDYINAIVTNQDLWTAYYADQELPAKKQAGLPTPPVMDSPALALVMSLTDDQGDRLFTDADAPIVNGWPYGLAERLYRIVLSINRLNDNTPQAVESEKKD